MAENESVGCADSPTESVPRTVGDELRLSSKLAVTATAISTATAKSLRVPS